MNLPPAELPPAAMEASPTPAARGVAEPALPAAETLPLESPFYFGGPDMDGPLDTTMPYRIETDGGAPLEAMPALGGWGLEDPYGEAYDGTGAPAPIYSTGTWFRRGNWQVDIEFAYWTQEDPRTTLIAFEGNPVAPQQVLLSTDDARRFQPGIRVSVDRFLGRDAGHRDHLVEFNFFGAFEWSAERTITAISPNGNTIDTGLSPVDVAGFSNANAQTFRYDTDLNSYEWNYLVRARPGRDQMALQPDGSWVRFKNSSVLNSWQFGLRMMMIDEASGIRVRDVNDTVTGVYEVFTNNDMFGPHFGLEHIESYDQWSWGMRGRLGALANLIDRRSARNPGDLAPEKLTKEQLSFVGEWGLFGMYQMRPNLALRAGYDVMYITGLCLAPENMGLLPTFPNLNSTGDSLFHGGTIGIEALW